MLPREHYPMVINTELEQIKFEIKKLEWEIDRSDDKAKAEYQEMIPVLRSKLRQAQHELKELEQATSENWVSIKANLDRTRTTLKSMWSYAASVILDS